MKFTIQNLGIQTINASSSTEFAIVPIPPTGTQIVADLTKDELVNNYNVSGNTIISVIGATGAEDYDAPVYQEYTATTDWILYDIGAYRVKWTLFNLDDTDDVFVSFSGFFGNSGEVLLAVNSVSKTFTRTTGSFITDGFVNAGTFTTYGFVNGGNNSTFTISNVTDTVLTCATAVGLVTEAASTGKIGTLSVAVNSVSKTFTRTTGSFLTDGFTLGGVITTSGFSNAGNNSTFTISTITDLVITCSTAVGLVTELAAAGRLLKTSAPPPDKTITVAAIPAAGTRLSQYGLQIDRTMNPERYLYVKCTNGTPILQVLAV